EKGSSSPSDSSSISSDSDDDSSLTGDTAATPVSALPTTPKRKAATRPPKPSASRPAQPPSTSSALPSDRRAPAPRTGYLFKGDNTVINGYKRRPVKLILINTPDRSGRTPMFRYSNSGDMFAVRALIDAGAQVDLHDNAGWTPLHEACLSGRTEVAELLLKRGADVTAAALESGDTPLHDAAENGHVGAVEVLLRHGADPHQRNKEGRTAVDVAEEQPEVLKVLRSWCDRAAHAHERDKYGQSQLHLVAMSGDTVAVGHLLRLGVDGDARDNAGWTPLHEACLAGREDVARMLLEYGCEVDPRAKGGDTPLMDACANGHSGCVRALLEYGADSKAKNSGGKTARDECKPSVEGDACRELVDSDPARWQPVKKPRFVKMAAPRQGDALVVHGVVGREEGGVLIAGSQVGGTTTPTSLSAHRQRRASFGSDSGSHRSGSERGKTAFEKEIDRLGIGFHWWDRSVTAADMTAQFSSKREERKFRELVKRLEDQGRGAGPSGGLARMKEEDDAGDDGDGDIAIGDVENKIATENIKLESSSASAHEGHQQPQTYNVQASPHDSRPPSPPTSPHFPPEFIPDPEYADLDSKLWRQGKRIRTASELDDEYDEAPTQARRRSGERSKSGGETSEGMEGVVESRASSEGKERKDGKESGERKKKADGKDRSERKHKRKKNEDRPDKRDRKDDKPNVEGALPKHDPEATFDQRSINADGELGKRKRDAL
ncbi:Set3 complex subunit with deacetylase activity, meiotic-specific repressor of sporulation proteins, partial [Gonapodya sp. JEL0774]